MCCHRETRELDLRGDATWRALERLYSGTVRRWVEIRTKRASAEVATMARHISYYAGGHTPRVFVGGEELRVTGGFRGPERFRPLAGYDDPDGRLALARITTRRYLDENSVGRLTKRTPALVQVAEIARLYQTMNLTVDEIRWRLEQLISLRFEVLDGLQTHRRTTQVLLLRDSPRSPPPRQPLPGPRRRRRSPQQVDRRALATGVPLVDIAYLSVTAGENF